LLIALLRSDAGHLLAHRTSPGESLLLLPSTHSHRQPQQTTEWWFGRDLHCFQNGQTPRRTKKRWQWIHPTRKACSARARRGRGTLV